MKYHTAETQATMTPAKALQFLKEGNQRFVNNLNANHDLLKQVNTYKDGQFPFAIILGCMDSRTTVEHIFDQGLGDVFSVRIAGNIVNEDILGSLEYACKVAGSKLILVLGHSKCGATAGACSGAKIGNLTQLLGKFSPSIDKVKLQYPGTTPTDPAFVDAVSHQNVKHSISEILDKSPVLKVMVEDGEIGIVGAFYNLETGEVEFMDEHIKRE